MDPPSILNPSLRIQQITSYQGGQQGQQAPFTQGQLLQGVVTGKNSDNLFTLLVGKHEFLAESATHLNIGQKLDLQVTTVTPRVLMQVLSDPLAQSIGKSIHLLDQQMELPAKISSLAATINTTSDLSPVARQTLALFANLLSVSPSATLKTSNNHQAIQQTEQLLSLVLSQLKTPPEGSTSRPVSFTHDMSALLSQIVRNNTTPAQISTVITQLQDIFSSPESPRLTLPFQSDQAVPVEGQLVPSREIISLLSTISQLYADTPQIQHSSGQLTSLFAQQDNLFPTQLLQQILNLPIQLVQSPPSQSSPDATDKPQLTGQDIQILTERLGLNLEQLLAAGEKEQAVRTLKFALLEFSQKSPASDKLGEQTHQATKTLELYQLLQLKLSNEGLFFIPLPFSFSEQGYLLIEKEREGDREKNESNKDINTKTYHLHLKLEGLGNLQVDITQENGKVGLKFFAANAQKTKFLASFREELNQWLTAADLESVQFLTGAEEPVKKLLGTMIQGSTGMVDTKA